MTSLDVAAALASEADEATITLEHAETALAMRALRYGDDEHYDVISAFIKSIRGSDVDAGLYWLARMLEAGEDARFIARRLVILASEDVGLADPMALPSPTAAAHAVEFVGLPEALHNLAHAVIYLANAPKSNRAEGRDRCGAGRRAGPAGRRGADAPAGRELPRGAGAWVTARATSILTTRPMAGRPRSTDRPRWPGRVLLGAERPRRRSATAGPAVRRDRARTTSDGASGSGWRRRARCCSRSCSAACSFALASLVATVRRLRVTVERLQAETLAITRAMQDALRDAEHEVDRVDALLTAAEGVGGRIDGASRLVTKTVTNPVVKVLAIGTGTKQAVRRIRGGRTAGGDDDPEAPLLADRRVRSRDGLVVVRRPQGAGPRLAATRPTGSPTGSASRVDDVEGRGRRGTGRDAAARDGAAGRARRHAAALIRFPASSAVGDRYPHLA